MSERICLWAAIGVAGLTLGLASCVPPPSQPPVAPPPPVQPAPPPPPPPPAAWEDAPLTPGSWSVARSAGGSTALFGAPSTGNPVSIRCESAGRRIVIARTGASVAPNPSLVIRTSFGAVAWPAVAVPGEQPRIEAARGADDPVFDQIAFSRGRFAVEGAGLPRVVMPAWAEVARVIEDCRG